MNTQQLIGDYFEDLLSRLFKLKRIDRNFSHKDPDLRGDTFSVESKASRFDNGGVIKGWQLNDLENLPFDCPYAFPYHELKTPISKYYATERALLHAIYLRSLYVLPISVVQARYETGYKRPYPTGDDFVQIRESLAKDIFAGKSKIWKTLNLNFKDYVTAVPKSALVGNIFIMNDNKTTLDKLLNNFTLSVYLAEKKKAIALNARRA
jgi:hypothetical protein